MKKREFEKTKVPISSLIDVVFLLIMFFVVTSVMGNDHEIPVNLTKTENMRPGSTPPHRILITVQEDGSTFVNNIRSYSSKDLEKRMRNSINLYGNALNAIIRGDADSRHKEISEIMEVLKRSGIKNIRIKAELSQ